MLNILIYDGVCGVVRITLDDLDVQEIKDTAELARSYAAKRGNWHVTFTKVLGRDKFACLDNLALKLPGVPRKVTPAESDIRPTAVALAASDTNYGY